MKEFLTSAALIGAFQGLFFALVLAIRSSNRTANRFLSILFVVISILFLQRYFALSENFYAVYYFSYIVPVAFFLHGPLIYFYTSSMTGKRINSKKTLLHLLPALGVFISHYLVNAKRWENIENIRTVSDFRATTMMFREYFFSVLILGSLSVILYTIFSLKIQSSYRRKLKDFFSDIERINLNWLRALLILFLIMFILIQFFYILVALDILSRSFFVAPSVFAFLVVLTASYLAITQQDLFALKENRDFSQDSADAQTLFTREIHLENKLTDEPGNDLGNDWENRSSDDSEKKTESSREKDRGGANGSKYEKMNLSEPESENIYSRLLSFMLEEKPYLEEDLTLKKLAEKLNIHSHHLSIVINRHARRNFYSFVNSYRLNEFQRLLEEDNSSSTNILYLAMSSGFNSKSTFNHIFKQRYGLTPSEYKKSLQQR